MHDQDFPKVDCRFCAKRPRHRMSITFWINPGNVAKLSLKPNTVALRGMPPMEQILSRRGLCKLRDGQLHIVTLWIRKCHIRCIKIFKFIVFSVAQIFDFFNSICNRNLTRNRLTLQNDSLSGLEAVKEM